MTQLKQYLTTFLIMLLLLAACTSGKEEAALPTATLANIVSMTPRYTATPVPSKTPLPTFTYTPSDTPIPPTPSDTPEPTGIPPVIGIISSTELVNVREGPGGSFTAFEALAAGVGVEIIGKNDKETWLLVRLEDGREGWIYGPLVRIQPSATPFPTMTPSPDLTRLFLGTPLPTALLGGGTVTPTPPRSVTTPTVISDEPETVTPTVTGDTSGIPVIDVGAINLTATALVAGIATPTPSFTPLATEANPAGGTIQPSATRQIATPSGEGTVRENARVFALCDDLNLDGDPPPTDLAAGSTIVVWWAWFATQESHIQDHLDNATYEVRVDGTLLRNVNQYRTAIAKPSNDYVVYWYVPYPEPLDAGEHHITYRVSWTNSIFDGYNYYGPGTNTLVEEGSCTFTVR